MKQLNLIRNLFSVAVMITLACNVSAQVSIRDRIQIMDRDVFNYPELTEAPVKTKKSKTNRIVYSDRTGNQSYEDPYFQRKRSSHGIGTPYYLSLIHIYSHQQIEMLDISENDILSHYNALTPVSYTHLDVYKRQIDRI